MQAADDDVVPHRRGRNPVLPLSIHLADPEARVMPDGALYVYGSLDVDESSFCSDHYRVASTTDLESWIVHDAAFRADQVSWATPTASGASFLDHATGYDDLPRYVIEMLPPGVTDTPFETFAAAVREETRRRHPATPKLYAPDAIEHDGRYYLYFCLSDGSEGVAVSEHPQGPFATPQRLPAHGIDPAVFVDDDGTAYLYWGQFSASAVRLAPTMTSFDPADVVEGLVTEATHHFHEGSSLRRCGDTYYLVFADTSRGRPTCLGYATAPTPLGPFTYRGVIIDNAQGDPEAWNNHGSIQEFQGRWYVFYHRNSRGTTGMRRVCIEPIEFSSDGLITEVPMTSQGAGPPFQLDEPIPGFTACEVDGGARIAPFDDREAIVGLTSGTSATFRYVGISNPCTSMRFDARGDGIVTLLVDGVPAGKAPVRAGRMTIDIDPGLRTVQLTFDDCVEPCVLLEVVFEAGPLRPHPEDPSNT